MKTTGVPADVMCTADFYSAHEVLLSEYEDALTRVDFISEDLYDTSAHFVQTGERVRQLDGAHPEMPSRVKNPVGVKLGPSAIIEDATHLAEQFNLGGIPGRLTLVSRLGSALVRETLPGLLRAGKAAGKPIVWMCGPMHGNTAKVANGCKTCYSETVLDEVRAFFEVREVEGIIPGGTHVELADDDVAEIVGDIKTVDEATLMKRYKTPVDPHLDHQQPLKLAFMMAETLAKLCPELRNIDLVDFPETDF